MARQKRQIDRPLPPVLGSKCMRDLDGVLQTVAGRDIILTLCGESGTGKEVLARRAHDLSARASGPFVPINAAAIPEALFESELFGHERGSFTGASERTEGKVEAARGGTLFLDEIGEMPLAMQAKMLRFVENRRFMRVGGHEKIDANVRIVCATLRPLEQDVGAGRFRADLFYRIQGITLRIPPLRDRRADIPPLIERFIADAVRRHGTTAPRISSAARAALLSYPWPGNIRELRNTIEVLALLREGQTARVRDLPEAIRMHREPEAAPSKAGQQTLAEKIDEIIRSTVAREGGNRRSAAAQLGISVRTIQRHLGPA